jgi:hypothetical protein
MIAPGGVVPVFQWDGMVLTPSVLPAECWEGDADMPCDVLRRAGAGDYTLTVGFSKEQGPPSSPRRSPPGVEKTRRRVVEATSHPLPAGPDVTARPRGDGSPPPVRPQPSIGGDRAACDRHGGP